MKLKGEFILRKLGDKYVVVAVGDTSKNFNGVIKLNATGAFLWDKLNAQTTEQELVTALTDKYDVDDDTARNCVSAFINKIREANLFE